MNKEEIEELKDFTIDITDIDELSLGLEVCSKKSNMVIQEFADTIIQLQQENQQQNQLLKDKGFIIDKLMEENRQLKESRYKAIGHINACGCVLTTDESRYLLDILKGDSNE